MKLMALASCEMLTVVKSSGMEDELPDLAIMPTI
jgi:hypothetical protein